MKKLIFLLPILIFLTACPSKAVKDFTNTKQHIDKIDKNSDYNCHKDKLEIAKKLYQEGEQYKKEGKIKEANESIFAADKILTEIENKKCEKQDKKSDDKEDIVKFDDQEIKVEEISDVEKKDIIENYKMEPVYFEFNSYQITDISKESLLKHIEYIQNGENIVIEISGHTDVRGSDEYNLILSEKRAKVIKKFYSDQGISEDKFTTIGYGEERITDSGDSDEAHTKNRRAEFNILKRK